MRVLAVVGSKRKKGNTYLLVREAAKALEGEGAEVRTVFLNDYSIQGCRGCEKCKDTYRCVIDDGMQDIYPLMLQADGLILGSPVYFYNISSDMQSFMERCYCLEGFDEEDRSCWVGVMEAMGGRYAVVITVGEQQEGRYMGNAAETMEMSLCDLGFRVVDTVKAGGLWAAGEAAEDREAMEKCARAGLRLARVMSLRKRMESHLRNTDGPGG